ncbi:MAG: protease pro-enzyme activation domain-containing protein [Candidatus Acidiferrales bacterium]
MLKKAGPVLALSSAVALLLLCSIPTYAQSNASHTLIKQNIDEKVLVTLAGNTRPEVQSARDMGPVSDSLQLSHMYLQMKMSPEQEADADALIEQLHNPTSAEYHHWLSPAQIEERFGPAQADVTSVSIWLESHGFTVNTVYRANGVIDFSGPASAIREAFHTEIHNIDVNGAMHIANIRDPMVPAALAPALVGVTSMNDFRPHMNLLNHRQTQLTAAGGVFALVPGDMATIYDINPVYQAGITGKGQSLMVVEDSDLYSADDWPTFRHTFGLDARFPFGSLTTVHPQPSNSPANGGACADPGVNGDDSETAVDVEWSSASAPNAAIILATCADTNANFGGFIAIQNVLTNFPPPPGVISISYGESESEDGASFNAYINGLYRLAVLRGVSVYVSAGDSGADASDQFRGAATRGLNVSGWTTTQYNVSIGGTDFTDTVLNQNATYWNATNGPFFNSAKSYIPEMPWNDSCANVPLSNFLGFTVPYGADGTCNNLPPSLDFLLVVAGGSGGASSCFTGTPAINGVVGGTCKGYPKPLYQYLAAGVPFDGVRDIPDITFFAANGLWGHYYIICYSDPTPGFGGAPCTPGEPQTWAGFGGTSFGAPIMAGVQALINESVGTRFSGDPNYVYYSLDALQNVFVGDSSCDSSLGTNASSRCIFHDVTFGDNDVNCLPLTNRTTGAVIGTFNCFLDGATNGVLSRSNSSYQATYTAKRGYDLTSGIGSPDVHNLVKSWPGSRLH